MALFTGCGVAIATPFNEDGSVDFEAYRDLINWQIDEGIDAVHRMWYFRRSFDTR